MLHHVPVVDLLEWPVPGRPNSRRNFLEPLVSNKLFTFLNLAHRSLSFASRVFSSSSPAFVWGVPVDDASIFIFGPGVIGLGDPGVPGIPLTGLGDASLCSCNCPVLFDFPL